MHKVFIQQCSGKQVEECLSFKTMLTVYVNAHFIIDKYVSNSRRMCCEIVCIRHDHVLLKTDWQRESVMNPSNMTL